MEFYVIPDASLLFFLGLEIMVIYGKFENAPSEKKIFKTPVPSVADSLHELYLRETNSAGAVAVFENFCN